ncbi:hypothetical protein FQZ97_829130 [compost metagenome]
MRANPAGLPGAPEGADGGRGMDRIRRVPGCACRGAGPRRRLGAVPRGGGSPRPVRLPPGGGCHPGQSAVALLLFRRGLGKRRGAVPAGLQPRPVAQLSLHGQGPCLPGGGAATGAPAGRGVLGLRVGLPLLRTLWGCRHRPCRGSRRAGGRTLRRLAGELGASGGLPPGAAAPPGALRHRPPAAAAWRGRAAACSLPA